MTVLAASPTANGHKPFPQFIQEFKAQLKHLFYIRSDINQLSIKRGMPPFILREIMSSTPLSTYIPEQYGGRSRIPLYVQTSVTGDTILRHMASTPLIGRRTL